MTPVRPSHVLYVTPAGERGGAETVLRTILQHLDRTRYEPLVACLADGPFVRDLESMLAGGVRLIPASRFRSIAGGLAVVRALRALIRHHGVRLVHDNGIGGHVYGSFAAASCGVPSMFHVHDVPDWTWSRQGLLQRVASRLPSARTIAVSRFVAAQLGGRHAKDVRVIANGVEIEAAGAGQAAAAAAVRARWGWPSDCPIALWCGRLQRWKGAHIFLQAAALARTRCPDARFAIVGGGLFGLEPAYERELRTLVASNGLADVVRFAGQQPDVRPYLAAAAFVVQSSTTPEAFGLVAVEAMALEKAVIASAHGASLEIVEPDLTGLLVPPGDAHALAEAMVLLLRDSARRVRLGQAGRRRVEERFSADRMTSAIQDLYDEIAPPHGVPLVAERAIEKHRAVS